MGRSLAQASNGYELGGLGSGRQSHYEKSNYQEEEFGRGKEYGL